MRRCPHVERGSVCYDAFWDDRAAPGVVVFRRCGDTWWLDGGWNLMKPGWFDVWGLCADMNAMLCAGSSDFTSKRLCRDGLDLGAHQVLQRSPSRSHPYVCSNGTTYDSHMFYTYITPHSSIHTAILDSICELAKLAAPQLSLVLWMILPLKMTPSS